MMEWMPPPDGIECAKVVMFSHPTNGDSSTSLAQLTALEAAANPQWPVQRSNNRKLRCMAPSVHNVNAKYGTRNPILITSKASGSAETLIVTEPMTLRASSDLIEDANEVSTISSG
jgi:hypothetical protein